MLMSDIQRKDIINIKNGLNLGKIIDLEVTEDGTIKFLIVSSTKMLRKINNEYKITFKEIKTIGEDVILVELS